MRFKKLIACIIVFACAYCGSYVVLRMNGSFMHHSNADHWHPEKRSPEHYVHAPGDGQVLLEATFWPLRAGEALFYTLLN